MKMQKKKKHKWKYQINVKKKVIVSLILGVTLFVGLGFALLENSINITGNILVTKYNKNAQETFLESQSGGCVKKYNNQHQDSMDSSLSTEDIYYYDGTNYSSCPIQEMNNVVFADSCWQMIRTTDTGGVRMLYNGEPEITEDATGETQYNCGSTRYSYHIGGIKKSINMSTSYKYAASYTSNSNGITLNDPQTVTIDSNNVDADVQSIIQNYPYMCTNFNSNNNTCYGSNFYKLDSQISGTTVYAYPTTAYRDVIGTSSYNNPTESLSRVGYKYGDDYINNSFQVTFTKDLSGSGIISDTSLTNLSQLKNYSDSISYVNDQYELDTPVAIASDIDRNLLVGKFVERQVSSTKTYYYITKNNGSSFYARQLTNGNTDVEIKISSTAYNKSLTEPSSSMLTITLADWAANYSSYVGKYTCGDSSTTCEYPRYIRTTSATGYTYTSIKPMYIGKSVDDNLQLVDYAHIPEAGTWNNGYNSGLQNYPYTCEDGTTKTCTKENLKYITARTATSYTYSSNYKFGTSVIYEDNKFKLQNVVDASAVITPNTLKTHHYTCLGGTGDTECTSVAYVHAYRDNRMYYIIINDPTITTTTQVLDNMLTKNTNDSIIKTKIDAWYESKFKNTAYESKIDDTIYCSDRSYSNFSGSGWNPNGGDMTKDLNFKDFNVLYPTSINIKCSRETDKFSVSNDQAKLNYPIGLISITEMRLFGYTGKDRARASSIEYWTMTPATSMINGGDNTGIGTPGVFSVTASGDMRGAWTIGKVLGIRPAISLTKNTEFYRGSGSTTDPYVVDMQGPVKITTWKKTRLSETTVNDISATTTIHNLGRTTNGNDLATIEYYTTCDSGTATGTVNNPSSASINGNKATITLMTCPGAKLHYRLKDSQGNDSEWNHVKDIGQYLIFAQVYNNMIYAGGSASNDNRNLSYWVNSETYPTINNRLINMSYYDPKSHNTCEAMDHDTLVERAYQTFLGRSSDSTKETWINKLDNEEETIESFFLKFINSTEAKNIHSAWGYDTIDYVPE